MKKFWGAVKSSATLVASVLFLVSIPSMADIVFGTNLADAGGEVTLTIIMQIIVLLIMLLTLRNTYREGRKADDDRRKASEERQKSDERYEKERKSAELRHMEITSELLKHNADILRICEENLRKAREESLEESRAQHREFMEYLVERDKNTAPCNCKRTFRGSRWGR